jgi:hypothetical protein
MLLNCKDRKKRLQQNLIDEGVYPDPSSLLTLDVDIIICDEPRKKCQVRKPKIVNKFTIQVDGCICLKIPRS